MSTYESRLRLFVLVYQVLTPLQLRALLSGNVFLIFFFFFFFVHEDQIMN